MNGSKDYNLLRKWLRLSGEIPANGGRVVRLSEKENFWSKESHFNYHMYRVVTWFIAVLCLVFSVQLFLVRFNDIDWCTYILVQAFHTFHISYTIFFFLPQLYMINIFVLQIIRFFCLNFKFFAQRLGRLDASRTKKINNRRLARLIHSYNQVHLELIEMNDCFKNFLGVNLLYFFIYAIILMFLVMFVGWILKLTLLWIVLTMFLTIIFIPFTFANSLLTEVW